MLPLRTLISLAIGTSMAFSGIRAQCLQNAGYLGGYDVSSGVFVGAVARNLGFSGIFTLDRSGDTSNYLAVVAWSTRCNDGGPVSIQILSPGDPNAGYISLVSGTTNCSAPAFTGPGASLVMVPSDGFPHGAYPTPAPTETTFGGGYGNLHTDCGESMIFALGSAIGRQVLLPAWRDPNGAFHTDIPLLFDITQNYLVAAADPGAYAAAQSAAVEQVYLSIFI
ncbi:hypothetical protein B0H13DRAFT_2053070 [Mycena leptocephala]|nr:hypothetical protein B0H13DRAFT_2053070 [Mycena leptocephala]